MKEAVYLATVTLIRDKRMEHSGSLRMLDKSEAEAIKLAEKWRDTNYPGKPVELWKKVEPAGP